MKTRKNILMILGLVLLLGGSYAFYTYQKYSGMQNLLNGEIYLNYLEDNEVHISGIFPETKEEALKRNDNTISFKVLSKNTSDKDIYYGITLNYGEEISNKIRIDAKYIMIYLECDGKVLIDGIRYSDFNNRRIYVDKIDAKTYTETTKNYTLRFWVDEETTISDTDSNASYKATEWASSYLNFKVNVDAGLETMNMPLSMETSDTYVENNKAYFIAKISNFINIEDLGKDSNDTMNLKVTGTNSDIKFSYKDSEGNTVEEKSDTLDLTYLFTKNKTVEIQVFVYPNNDANGKTNILLEIYKNKELMQSFIKRVEVKGNNYCLNNGFNKLVDCMLVSDSLSESVDIAKTNIANKGEPNLNDTAPSYTYVEELIETENSYIVQNQKYYFSKTYEFDEKTGTFKLTGDVINDYLSEKYIGYWFEVNSGSYYNLNTIYFIQSVELLDSQIVVKAIKRTYKIASSIRSEVGLYKTEDDYGDVYYYRGDVQNNNVYFGGYYWKIIRTNGDGSLRLIYNGKVSNAQNTDTEIGKYSYNAEYRNPASVGYMYGDNYEQIISDELTINGLGDTGRKYYFASDYEVDETNKKYKLKGNVINGTIEEVSSKLSEYPWTCEQTALGSCRLLIKINSYINSNTIKGQYYAYALSSYADTKSNNKSSSIKEYIDSWYEKNILNLKDKNGNNLSDYIKDETFCNNRNLDLSVQNNSGYRIDESTRYISFFNLRSSSSKQPSLKCDNISDKFSVTLARGNGNLKYPIALITADEVSLAGGYYGKKNEKYYLTTGEYYWTITPSDYKSNYAFSYVFQVFPEGDLRAWAVVSSWQGIRPVINICSDVLISSGDGTMDSPYNLKLS